LPQLVEIWVSDIQLRAGGQSFELSYYALVMAEGVLAVNRDAKSDAI
jgi:hypothetical protein